MNDLISRRDAIDALNEHRAIFCDNTPETFRCLPHDEKCRVDEIDTAISVLVNLPSAEPEIVRCKNCENSEHWYGDRMRCFLWHKDGISVFEDGFCNYAKRRKK